MAQTLKQIAQRIRENCRAVGSHEITWAQFSERQRDAWDAVARGEQNIIGSACSRRHVRVMRHLEVIA